MSASRITWVLAAGTIAVLVLAVPGAARHAIETGDVYLFSQAFFADLPRRLSGPGKMRFVFQPIVAIALGVLSHRRPVRHQFANLFLVSILLDLAAQWLILGVAYPAAALVVGPTLISLPFLTAREGAHRWQTRNRSSHS